MRVGYVRISTTRQTEDLQRDALAAASCERVFEDVASGAKDDRAGLAEALEFMRPGDVLVVWRFDRLARSLRNLIDLVNQLRDGGVELISLREGVDTTTPAGRFAFHLFGAVAEFERDLIRERVQAGLAAARARGRVGGRPKKATAALVAEAQRLYDARVLSMAQITKATGLGKTTLYRVLEVQK